MFTVYGVTYTFTTNYGTCLQSFALMKALEKMSVSKEEIAYRLIPIAKSPGYPHSNKGLKQRLKNMVNMHSRKQFVAFEDRYMKYASVRSLTDFSLYNSEADAFVCGSDMIWNPKFSHELSEYYLDFANKYSFSYSASFGQSDIDVSKYKWIKECMSKLREISVREPQSAVIAGKFTDRNIEITVDPVLLLDQDDWNKIALGDNTSGDYIFVYSVNTTKLLNDFVNKLSKQTGLKIIHSGGNPGAVLKQGLSKVFTPDRWLQLIRDAKYIVTDSFHGTAFSVIFRKNLFTITNGDPNTGFNMRMSDFLGGLGLDDRIFISVPEKIDCSDIDYSDAENLLNKQIDHSLKYLQMNLEAAYKEKSEVEANKET